MTRQNEPQQHTPTPPPQNSILQRRATSQSEVEAVPPIVHDVLNSSGQPLDSETSSLMQSRFEHDFSDVRIHHDSQAATSAQAMSAQAYTVGQHIVFGAGQYAPDSTTGKRLLAHELTHTLQQQLPAAPIAELPASEQEADRAADAVVAGNPISIQTTAPIGVARQPLPSSSPISADLTDSASPFLARAIGSITIDNFGLGSTKIPPGREGELRKTAQQIIKLLKRYPRSIIRVIGHTDTVGEAERNQSLGSDRAAAVQTVLVGEGVPSQQLEVTSKGETAPAISTTDNQPEGRNRRVVVQFEPGESLFKSMLPDLMQPPPSFQKPGVPSIDPLPKIPLNPAKPGSFRDPLPSEKGTLPPGSAQNLPADKVGQIKELTELLKITTDSVQKDRIIRTLRDWLSELQPVIPAKDTKKMIDDAIKSLIESGADKGILEILKLITGKSPTSMPENRNQTGPDVKPKDLDEKIYQSPKIPIKDAPAPVPRFSFEYRNGPQPLYEAGSTISFTLIPPDNLDALQGTKRVVIVAEAERNSPNAERFDKVVLEAAAPKKNIPIVMQAPQKPGKYVIRVDIGMGFDYSNMQEFEVKPSSK